MRIAGLEFVEVVSVTGSPPGSRTTSPGRGHGDGQFPGIRRTGTPAERRRTSGASYPRGPRPEDRRGVRAARTGGHRTPPSRSSTRGGVSTSSPSRRGQTSRLHGDDRRRNHAPGHTNTRTEATSCPPRGRGGVRRPRRVRRRPGARGWHGDGRRPRIDEPGSRRSPTRRRSRRAVGLLDRGEAGSPRSATASGSSTSGEVG